MVKKMIASLLIMLVVVIGTFASYSIAQSDTRGIKVDTYSAESVSVVGASGVSSKYVYGTNDGSPTDKYEIHCKNAGGVFNTCGSSCPEGAPCAAVCVYTCDNIPIIATGDVEFEGSLGGYHLDTDLDVKSGANGKTEVVTSTGVTTVEILPEEAIVKAFGPESKNVEVKLEEKTYNNVPAVVYKIEGTHNGKFLGIFKIGARYQAAVDAETGDVLEWNGPWWSFLITGEPDEPVVKDKVAPIDPVGVLE